jgi:hypothetical protein
LPLIVISIYITSTFINTITSTITISIEKEIWFVKCFVLLTLILRYGNENEVREVLEWKFQKRFGNQC